jgi:RNA polymerase sporulation-specific sigma factor
MFKKIIEFIKECMFFTTSYSVNVFPQPLSSEEENECILKAKSGDENARAKLIEHNLRLVAHIVKKYDRFKEDADDLISIGTIGLIKGIDSYSPHKGVKLTTYAAKCAENEILMYFRSNKKNANNVSLNDCIGYDKDGNEITLVDVLKEQNKEIIENVFLKDNINLLKEYIKVLSEREKIIIIMRYGLLETKEQTQKEIAKKLHISRSYVSRIEKRALVKMLREFLKNQKC